MVRGGETASGGAVERWNGGACNRARAGLIYLPGRLGLYICNVYIDSPLWVGYDNDTIMCPRTRFMGCRT